MLTWAIVPGKAEGLCCLVPRGLGRDELWEELLGWTLCLWAQEITLLTMATILLTSPSPGESPVLSKAIHKPAESKARMGESIEPRILPPWAYSPHSAWGFLRLTSVGLFVYGEHLSLLPLSDSSNYHTNLPMGTVIRNSIKWSICRLWIVSPTNAFLPRLRVLLFWEYKSHCTHSV